jgi:hypothetical protein
MAVSILSKTLRCQGLIYKTPLRSLASVARFSHLGETASSTRRPCSPSWSFSRSPGLDHSKILIGFNPKPIATSRHFSAVAVDYDLRDGIEFGHLLEYLQEQYGLAQKAVEGKLCELANILGYEVIGLKTIIQYSDLKILMEELGAYPATRREFRRFLEGQGYKLDESSNRNYVQEFYQLQKQQDVLDLAEKRDAQITTCPERRGWLRLTLANGSALLFKSTKGRVQWLSMS